MVSSVLTSLHLGGNDLGVEGAKALAASLAVNSVLTNLNLSWNGLDAEVVQGKALAVPDDESLVGRCSFYSYHKLGSIASE